MTAMICRAMDCVHVLFSRHSGTAVKESQTLWLIDLFLYVHVAFKHFMYIPTIPCMGAVYFLYFTFVHTLMPIELLAWCSNLFQE